MCVISSRAHIQIATLWNPYRRVSSRGQRAQIRYSRGARGEKPENDRPPFWFYGESIRTSVHGSHVVSVEAPSRNAFNDETIGKAAYITRSFTRGMSYALCVCLVLIILIFKCTRFSAYAYIFVYVHVHTMCAKVLA